MPLSLAPARTLPGESTFSLSIRRSTAAGIAVSVVIHLLAVLLLVPHIKKMQEESSEPPAPGQITAQIRLPSQPAPRSEPTPAQPDTTPTPPTPEREPQRRRPTPQRPTTPPPIIARRSPEAPTQPLPTRPLPPLPPVQQTPPDSNPETDMSANMRQRQQRREAMEDSIASGNRQPSENAVAMARIKENLRQDRGAGGVFQVRDMGMRSATIYFNGWRGDRKRVMEESFEVDAGMSGDVERAVVMKIIEIIRRDYTTEFTWQSHRLGRERQLSARPEDTAELERFLRLEFQQIFANARRR